MYFYERVSEDTHNLLSKPFMTDENQARAGASTGIVRYPLDGVTLSTQLKRADLAMFCAKNTHRYFTSDMDNKSEPDINALGAA